MTEQYIADFQSIADIVNEELIYVEAAASIESALKKMLINSKYEAIVVKKINDNSYHNNALGIITIADIGRLVREKINLKDKIGNWTNNNITTINLEENIRTSKLLMKENGIERLLVLRDGKIVGMLTTLELFRNQDFEKGEIELQLRLILGNLHEAVCVINTSGIVTFWNSSAEKLYDIKAKEIVGSHIEKFFPNALLLKALNERKTFENLKQIGRAHV